MKPAQQRQAALASLMARLYPELEADAPAQIPSVISLGEHKLELDAWERSVLQQRTAASCAPWAFLLAEGVAFRVKSLSQIDRLDRVLQRPDSGSSVDAIEIVEVGDDGEIAAADSLDDLIEQAITDAAVGLAVAEETQRLIAQLITCGEHDPAKRLTAFRNKIHSSLDQLKQMLGEEHYQRAENKAQGMVPPLQPNLPNSLTVDTGKAWGPAAAAMLGESIRSEERTSKLKPLLLMMAVSCLAWMVLALPNLLREDLHVLQPTEFVEVPGVSQILARPPSLYVEVGDNDWSAMTRDEQIALVEQVGAIAAQVEYFGAHVKTSSGDSVGQWLRKRGAKLIEPVDSPAVTP